MDPWVVVLSALFGGAVVAAIWWCARNREQVKQVVASNYVAGSAFHNVVPELMHRGRISAMETSPIVAEGCVVRVALTGGPCGGKSSSLPHIIKSGKLGGFDVYTAPAIPKLLQNCGGLIPDHADGKYNFWAAAAKLQLAMEASLVGVARETRRASIVVFDNGVMDIKARVSESEWEKLLYELHPDRADDRPEDIENSILAQYEAAFHLVSAAHGAERFYKLHPGEKGLALVDAVANARALDDSLWAAWSGHPRHIKVNNAGAVFSAKLKKVADEVLEVARESLPPVEHGQSQAVLDPRGAALLA